MLNVFEEVQQGRYEVSGTVKEEEKAKKKPWVQSVGGAGSNSEVSSLDEHKVEEDQVEGEGKKRGREVWH